MTDTRRYVIQGLGSKTDRVAHALEHMAANRAYRSATGSSQNLDGFRRRFAEYRERWRTQPARLYAEGGDLVPGMAPLCVDLETSAMCDLACPFCYRQSVATPDKIMPMEVATRAIAQAAELGVPSMKFNWRGEPLLHPQLPELIARAKDAGVLDTIINTNAVRLDEAKARELIESGLDFVIYSFDGGSKQSYERMRPGRFAENSFETVYANIRRFAELKRQLGSPFPWTKIQMVLTEETFPEQQAFFDLFSDCVDEVSVKAYTERGGALTDLPKAEREQLTEALEERGLPHDTPYWRDMEGTIHYSVGRLACEQPCQRLLVSYSGLVGMCCYDWGLCHPVGSLEPGAKEAADHDCREVLEAVSQGRPGYAHFGELALPKRNTSGPNVADLGDIWRGAAISGVRRLHAMGNVDSVEVCKTCPFKETYNWKRLS